MSIPNTPALPQWYQESMRKKSLIPIALHLRVHYFSPMEWLASLASSQNNSLLETIIHEKCAELGAVFQKKSIAKLQSRQKRHTDQFRQNYVEVTEASRTPKSLTTNIYFWYMEQVHYSGPQLSAMATWLWHPDLWGIWIHGRWRMRKPPMSMHTPTHVSTCNANHLIKSEVNKKDAKSCFREDIYIRGLMISFHFLNKIDKKLISHLLKTNISSLLHRKYTRVSHQRQKKKVQNARIASGKRCVIGRIFSDEDWLCSPIPLCSTTVETSPHHFQPPACQSNCAISYHQR